MRHPRHRTFLIFSLARFAFGTVATLARSGSMPRCAAAALALGFWSGPAWAADPQSTAPFVPVQVEDAFPTGFNSIEFQTDAHYTRDTHAGGGGNNTVAEPVLKLGGPIQGMQLTTGLPHNFGDTPINNSGGATVSMLYQLNNNTAYLPAFAVDTVYLEPTGPGHHTGFTTLRGIATKFLGEDATAPRFHVNLSWYHFSDPSASQQRNQYEVGIAYSQLLTVDTAAVVDFVHGDKTQRGQRESIIDIGVRHLVSDTLAVSFGGGFGMGQQSPAFRILFAVQKDFSLF
jgi:hypothetical protein